MRRAVSGCLDLASFVDGAEGSRSSTWPCARSSIREAFIELGAFQWSFCMPGATMMTRQLLDERLNKLASAVDSLGVRPDHALFPVPVSGVPDLSIKFKRSSSRWPRAVSLYCSK